jgi:transglutaminase-like putative cysteine protease
MRMLFGVAFALMAAAGAAVAGESEHRRGEFRFFVDSEPGFVDTTRQVPATWDPKAPGATGAAWRVWAFDEQVDRRQGKDHVYIDYAYQPQSASLLGDAGRYQIEFNPEYQKLVLHRVELRRGGVWQNRFEPDRISLARREEDFEKDLSNGNVTALIVLDDVRVDDVVRIRYSLVGSNPIVAGQIIDSSNFGWGRPILWSRLRILYEPGTKVDVRRERNAPTAHNRNTSDAAEVAFEASRIPAYADEGSYPLWYQRYPAVSVSRQRTWSDVVRWALPLYPAAETLPPDLEKELAAWTRLPTPQERATAALRAVQEQVRYFGAEMGANSHRPHPPSETWTRRYGDCKDKAYLLTTLLERMGIKAAPALVSTRHGRGIADTPAAASIFNHVIVRAEVAGEILWLDPTITSEGGQARQSDASVYGLALPVMAGVTALETIKAPADAHDSVEMSERYEPAGDGKEIGLVIETVYRGRKANDMRRSLSSARNDEIGRRYAEYYRKRFGDITVVKAPVISDEREANRLVIGARYLLKAPFEGEGSTRALRLYAEALSGPAQLPESVDRTAPLYAGMPAHYRHQVQVKMPERWTVSLGDESDQYRSEAFAYERSLTIKDGEIQLTHDLRITDRDVAVDKVGPHLAQLRKVRDELNSRLPLKVPGGDDRQGRDARLRALLKDLEEGTQ